MCLPLKLRPYLIVLVVGLLVLANPVSAVENSHIALYPLNSIYDACNTISSGDPYIDTFKFESISDEVHNWSSTISVDENGTRYIIEDRNLFQWNCNNRNITVNVPSTDIWGFYLPRASTKSSQIYDVYIDGIMVASYNLVLNNTASLIPIFNISNPSILTKGIHNITVSHSSPIISTRKFGYKYIVGVRFSNDSISNYTISYPSSSVYHKDFSVSIIGDIDSTMEISSVTMSLNGQYSQSLTTSGNFNFNASKTVNMLNNLNGNVNLTVNVTDSYGNENISNYTIQVVDAPDVLSRLYFNASGITSGDTLEIIMEMENNGTINATDYSCNLTLDSGDVEIDFRYMNISNGTKVNTTINLITQTRGGFHTLNLEIINSTDERGSMDYDSDSFKIPFSRWGEFNNLSDVIDTIILLDENGTEIFSNSTSGLLNDYIEIDPSILNNSANATINMTCNQEYLNSKGWTCGGLTIIRWNESTSSYDNMTTDIGYILVVGNDSTNKWIVTTKFSSYGIIYYDPIPDPEPDPDPTPPSSSSNGGGIVIKKNIILICNIIDCDMSKDVIDILSDEFKIFKFDAYTFIEMNKTIPHTTAIIILGREKALDGIGDISKIYYPSQGDYHKFYFKFFPYKRRVFVFGGKDRYETSSFFKENYTKIMS